MIKVKGLTIEGLAKMAKKISEDEDFYKKDGLVLTYTVSEDYHKKINEELHYRILQSKEELEYSEIIEVTLFGVDFKIFRNDE